MWWRKRRNKNISLHRAEETRRPNPPSFRSRVCRAQLGIEKHATIFDFTKEPFYVFEVGCRCLPDAYELKRSRVRGGPCVSHTYESKRLPFVFLHPDDDE